MTLNPHPIMMIATAKVTRLSQRAESSILIAPVPPLYFDWRVLTDGGAEAAGGRGGSFRCLRADRRQRVIGEVGGVGLLQQGLVGGVPEIVECADCLHGRLALRIRHRRGDDEIIDLDAVGGKG